MITRKRKINPNATEVQLAISFSLADVRRWLELYVDLFLSPLTQHEKRETTLERARSWKETEDNLRYWLEHDKNVFANYEEPFRSQLSCWAWCQIVSKGYLTPSGTKEGEYLPTEKLLKLIRC